MTENAIRVGSVVLGFVAASMVLPHCAAAQSLEALDQLVLASAKPADGLALARSQAGSGALLDALATLERVLLTDPGNKPASLLHASILCRIDDRDGAAAEFARLKAKDYKKPEWAAARAPCDAPEASRQGAAK
ncbi:MAG: tetratricopeptide repeat protein [Novosphingobium sp.]